MERMHETGIVCIDIYPSLISPETEVISSGQHRLLVPTIEVMISLDTANWLKSLPPRPAWFRK